MKRGGKGSKKTRRERGKGEMEGGEKWGGGEAEGGEIYAARGERGKGEVRAFEAARGAGIVDNADEYPYIDVHMSGPISMGDK